MGWGGKWERGSGWGTHVNPWLIHVNVWQKPQQQQQKILLPMQEPQKIPGTGRSPGGEHGNPSLSGESHGQRSLAGYSLRGHKESDTTQQLSTRAKSPALKKQNIYFFGVYFLVLRRNLPVCWSVEGLWQKHAQQIILSSLSSLGHCVSPQRMAQLGPRNRKLKALVASVVSDS